MLSKFILRRVAVTTELVACFSQPKIPRHKEPCYYEPLPQTLPKKKFQDLDAEEHAKFDRYSLDPHSYWITQGKGTERPFTGKYWETKDLGHYQCVVCSNTLFLSNHKYHPPTGIASFWSSVRGAVKLTDDIEDIKTDNVNLTTKLYDNEKKSKRVCCAKCDSHLGTLHSDGPPPTFKRFSINSGAVDFMEKPWWHPPQYYRKMRQMRAVKRQEAKDIKKLNKRKQAEEEKASIFTFDQSKFLEVEKSAKVDNNSKVVSKNKDNEGEKAAKKL